MILYQESCRAGKQADKWKKGGNNSYYNIWIEWRASKYYNDYSLSKLNGICHSMLLCMPNISNYYER